MSVLPRRPFIFVAAEPAGDEGPGPGPGYHALWAARVPFLPALRSTDFTRLGAQRLALVQERQARLVRDLARASDDPAARVTFELRFIARRQASPGRLNRVEIALLAKAFAPAADAAVQRAAALWDRLRTAFPVEDPFNYPLEPLDEPGFLRCYASIPFDQLRAEDVLEIRKHEDRPLPSGAPLLAQAGAELDYIAHPLAPDLGHPSLARLFEALATQTQTVCYVAASLRPTQLTTREVQDMSLALGLFNDRLRLEPAAATEYARARAAVGAQVYERLLAEREQLLLVRLHVVGAGGAPRALAEALGAEIVGGGDSQFPTRWATLSPAHAGELGVALANLRWLELEPWGSTAACPRLARLRYLATPREALGAFRLPVPPESGYLPGLLVKHEPFVAPADDEDQDACAGEAALSLGEVYHHGRRTPQSFRLQPHDLTRHALIAGSTGSGKTTTIKNLLTQLWRDHRVPFLVLYPIDKRDYRELRHDPALAEDLLVFTVGDERTAPFRFNPFEVPEGVLLKTHLSRLMSVFEAAFSLVDPLPMVYREALRRVYRAKGWDRPSRDRGAAGRPCPILAELYAAITEVVDDLGYGQEVQATVSQAAVIRIGDLLEHAGDILNVRHSMPVDAILQAPTVMELGRVGSLEDTALVMGFLLVRFIEEVERRSAERAERGGPAALHVTVVEEAHRLMGAPGPERVGSGHPRGAASEDFSNLLAEVRGYGEGIIIAEQMPSLLVPGAVGNTSLKVMHWLEDASSFALFSDLMNLSADQREYARTLAPGFAVVRSRQGRPVHVYVPAEEQPPTASERLTSDAAVSAHMRRQRQRLGFADAAAEPWAVAPGRPDRQVGARPAPAASGPWRTSPETLMLLLRAPMQACVYCKPLHQSGTCPYGTTVRLQLANHSRRARWAAELAAALACDEPAQRWEAVDQFVAQQAEEPPVDAVPPSERASVAYCVLANLIDGLVAEARSAPPAADQRADLERRAERGRALLREFDARCRAGQER